MKTLRIALCCALFCIAALPVFAEDVRQEDLQLHVAIPQYGHFVESLSSALEAITKESQLEEIAGLVPMFAQMLPPFSEMTPESRIDIVTTKDGNYALVIAGTEAEAFSTEENEDKEQVLEMMGTEMYVAATPKAVVMSPVNSFGQGMVRLLDTWTPSLTPKGQIIVGTRLEEGQLVSMLELDREKMEKEIDDFIENPTTDGMPEGLTPEEAKELAQEFKKLLPDFMEELKKVTYMTFDLNFGETDMTIATEVHAAKTDALTKVGELMSEKMLNAADIKNQTKIETADGKVTASIVIEYSELNKGLKSVKTEESNDDEEGDDEEKQDAA